MNGNIEIFKKNRNMSEKISKYIIKKGNVKL